MRYDTHVYLGPTLSVETAMKHLWQAHYHPPIKCGDIIRILRLEPKKIVIIDGLYETVPAVWHKEILLALELGIEVWGAASMGALRAAELYQYGMHGFGAIFNDFKNGVLCDDDEVAVLHHQQHEKYKPINDAMVNIRATCEYAWSKNVITAEEKLQLIKCCKSQFYPYRLLTKAIGQLSFANKDRFSAWLTMQGMIDLKQNDAIAALTHIQTHAPIRNIKETDGITMPATKFIASLIDEAEITPFDFQASWLPDIENRLHLLSHNNPTEFRIVYELAKQIKQTSSTLPDTPTQDIQTSLNYIKQHQLYIPTFKYNLLHEHPKLFTLYQWLLHSICINNISKPMVESYLPSVSLYFNLSESNQLACHQILALIVILTLLGHIQLNDKRIKIKQSVISDHLRDSGFWFRYHQQNQKDEINLRIAVDFIAIYVQVTYIYQGFRDVHSKPKLPNYFNWIYDAFILYESTKPSINSTDEC